MNAPNGSAPVRLIVAVRCAVAGGGDGDVGRGPAEVLAERFDLAQRHADLLRIDVHADPPHRDHVKHGHHPAFARSHSRLATCSAAAPSNEPFASGSTRSCSTTSQPS